MSLSGNLEDVSVADALQFIHLGGRTGTLTLAFNDVSAEIGFHQGRIVNAWGPGSKRLGELLVDSKVIDAATLEQALQKQAGESPRRSLGQILVAMNALAPETMYRAVEHQIERTVYDLVTWTQGTFHFALDDLKPIDDIAVFPGDVIRHLNLDTQMVLLDALRIFDERNRDAALRGGPVPTPAAGMTPVTSPQKAPARTAAPAANGPPQQQQHQQPAPAAPSHQHGQSYATTATDAVADRMRLQVVSADRQLAEKIAQAMPPAEATVVRLTLRDAGTPPPGEQPPIVLIDLRQGGVALEAISALRRARPRASILAVVDAGVPLAQVYQAGAMTAVSGDVSLILACFRSMAQNRRDLLTGGVRAE